MIPFRTLCTIRYLIWLCFFIALPLQSAPTSEITWTGWSEANFAQAKKENRFILLDLEAVWCHWCHVMEQETYSKPEIIQLINDHFIAVKVDQDSRPDLSIRYQDYGWPATVIFNANGQEVAISSGYIPPEKMKDILESVIKNPVTSSMKIETPTAEVFNLDPYLSKQQRDALIKSQLEFYDEKNKGWGGIGDGQKYLDPDVVEHAITQAKSGDNIAARMAKETLNAQMALLDPVWGGMYQYSVGGDWKKPHFEKITWYQAEDMRIYSLAYMLWKDPRYLQTAEKIEDYLTHFLLSPEGAFYTSQNADLIDGKHSADYFALNDAERRKLGMPRIDKHIYARENGWDINGLTYLYMASGNATYLEQAERAAKWIIENRSLPDGGFSHDAKDIAGPYLGDTLAMGRAFLTLYQATANRTYLTRAQQAANFINTHFKAKSDQPGFITAVPSGDVVLNQTRSDPQENVMLVRFVNFLYQYTGSKTYKTMAQTGMRYLATPDIANKLYPASVLLADQELSQDPLHLTVVGFKNDQQAQALYNVALAYPSSYKRIEWLDRKEGALPNGDVEYPMLNKAAAFVCINRRCSLPVFNPQDLPPLIERLTMHKAIVTEKKISTQDKAAQLLANKNWGFIILGFLGFGLLLSFTPCVLPMLPILASIIVGQGQTITTRRAFGLSLTYVLAMAFTYSLAGIVAGLAGSYVQAYLQNPWVLGGFSLIFVLLALSLFGVYELQLPSFVQQRFNAFSNNQVSGTYTGVALMGFAATLIASPCITAPLVGVLSYVGQTGDAWLGGIALFVLGIGMGIPILIVGTLGGRFIPKAGAWLDNVKVVFGLILLGVAIWFLERILPDFVVMLLWSALAVLTAVYMGLFDKVDNNRFAQFVKGLSFVVMLYAFVLALGAFMGSNNYLHPLELKQTAPTSASMSTAVTWQRVTSLSELQQALQQAKANQKPAIVDFYADWCISCKDMIKNVFPDPVVNNLLSQFTLIRADVTNDSTEQAELTKHFNVIAPPTFIFFGKDGNEIKPRVDGEESVQEFTQTLQHVLTSI
jgi:thiol:disulfide interchange protein